MNGQDQNKTRKKSFQIILPSDVVIVFLEQCSQGATGLQGSKEQTGHQKQGYPSRFVIFIGCTTMHTGFGKNSQDEL